MVYVGTERVGDQVYPQAWWVKCDPSPVSKASSRTRTLGLRRPTGTPRLGAHGPPGQRGAASARRLRASSATSSRLCKGAKSTGGSVPLPVSRQVLQAVSSDEIEKRIGGFAHQPPIRIEDWAEGIVPRARDDDSLDGSIAVRIAIVEALHVRVLDGFQPGQNFCCKSPSGRTMQ